MITLPRLNKYTKSDLIKIIEDKNLELAQLRDQVSQLRGQLERNSNHTGLSTPRASAVYQDAQRSISKRRHLMNMAADIAKRLHLSTRVVGNKIEYLQSPGLWIEVSQEQGA